MPLKGSAIAMKKIIGGFIRVGRWRRNPSAHHQSPGDNLAQTITNHGGIITVGAYQPQGRREIRRVLMWGAGTGVTIVLTITGVMVVNERGVGRVPTVSQVQTNPETCTPNPVSLP